MLHLLKLCVGAESVEDLQSFIDARKKQATALNIPFEQYHTTRMVPKRASELTDGGSLYWVIKGNIQCRQELLEIRPFVGQDGIRRCNLIVNPHVILTQIQPKRPFQGWRYFKPEDTPKDLNGAGSGDLSPALQHELSDLGLL